MPTLRDVKLRIEAAKKIQKVTKAMQTIASIKLNRREKDVLGFRPYAEKMQKTFASLSMRCLAPHPLLTQKGGTGKILIIPITSDRGFCGNFNVNIYQAAAEAAKEKETELIVIGKKGCNYFSKKNFAVLAKYQDINNRNIFSTAEDITKTIVELYRDGAAQKAYIVFNRFKLHLLGKTEKLQLLPVETNRKEAVTDFIYEPGTEEFLDKFIPGYITTQIAQTIQESQASEEMARMVAMKYATDNARDLIETLSLDYHKARQAAITRELIEVVSGRG